MSSPREEEELNQSNAEAAERLADDAAPSADDDAAGADAGDSLDPNAARINELEVEVAELKAKYLRSIADYQNLARRAAQSEQSAREQELASIARSLLPALDQFDQALDLDREKTSVESIMSGIQMVRDEFYRAMQSHQIERFDAEIGQEFDANRHEALMQAPAEGVKSGCVTMQMQPGYAVGGRTIRPAKVAVAP